MHGSCYSRRLTTTKQTTRLILIDFEFAHFNRVRTHNLSRTLCVFDVRQNCLCSALICVQLNPHILRKMSVQTCDVSQNDVVGKMALPALYCRLYTLPRSCATHSYSFFFFIHFNFFSHGLVSFSIPCTAIHFEIESNDKCRQFNSNHDDGGTSRTP